MPVRISQWKCKTAHCGKILRYRGLGRPAKYCKKCIRQRLIKKSLVYSRRYVAKQLRECPDEYRKRHREEERKRRRTAKGRKYQRSYRNRPDVRTNHAKRESQRRKLGKTKASQDKSNRTMDRRHAHMLRRAKELARRGKIGWPMTFAQHQAKLYYSDGRQRPCHYCGHENNKTGSGCDRKNNSMNYTTTNSIACCRGCNAWKGAHRSYEQTREHFRPMREAIRKALETIL